jgi:hypothetical protein
VARRTDLQPAVLTRAAMAPVKGDFNNQPGDRLLRCRSRQPPVLRLAIAGYLARFKNQSCIHADSDLRSYLTRCEPHVIIIVSFRVADS